MASAELSRRAERAVGYAPLSEMGEQQRREFHEFNRRLAAYPSGFRCKIDAFGGAAAGEWRLLAQEAQDRNEHLNGYDPVLDFEPPKRRTVPHGTPTSTSTGAGRVQLEHDDPLRRIPASQYLPAVAGVEVSSASTAAHPAQGMSKSGFAPMYYI